MMIFNKIIQKYNTKSKLFAILIDPDRYKEPALLKIIADANECHVDFILTGGSLLSERIEDTISIIKDNTSIPVLLFPGSPVQISPSADGILLLSLISGRNPEFLIGNHVVAAPLLKKSKLDIIPTGYILTGSCYNTSVAYMSNTIPIPSSKKDIIVATAIAGEMLGHKLIYLEGGSGADKNIDQSVIAEVAKNISIPLITGGGLKTQDEIINAYTAGADMVVIGNVLEEHPDMLRELAEAKNHFNQK
jgi:putative glycerol-1-phosphate prenyltransferase